MTLFTPLHSRQHTPYGLQAGFSLIETLVASSIVAFSLLGLSIMHINALRVTHNAYYEAKASGIAFETLELVRENSTGISAYLVNSASYDCNSRASSDLCIASSHTKTACSANQLAEHHTFIAICGYKKDNVATGGIRNLLPNGRLLVQCIAADGSFGTDCSESKVNVRVLWDEQALINSDEGVAPRMIEINGAI